MLPTANTFSIFFLWQFILSITHIHVYGECICVCTISICIYEGDTQIWVVFLELKFSFFPSFLWILSLYHSWEGLSHSEIIKRCFSQFLLVLLCFLFHFNFIDPSGIRCKTTCCFFCIKYIISLSNWGEISQEVKFLHWLSNNWHL